MHLPFRKKHLILFLLLFFALQYSGAFIHSSRTITEEQWKKLVDKSFDYKNDIENIKPPINTDANAFQKVILKIISFFGNGVGNALIWLLLIGIVVYIIYRLFFSSDSFLFGKNKKTIKPDAESIDGDEDITSTDWETLLRNATRQNDFRLATRYSYMWLLQLLQRQGLILYRTDKTNFEYYNELSETAYKQTFRQLSRQYEYAWYGHFEVSEIKYDEYMSLFNQLRNRLNS